MSYLKMKQIMLPFSQGFPLHCYFTAFIRLLLNLSALSQNFRPVCRANEHSLICHTLSYKTHNVYSCFVHAMTAYGGREVRHYIFLTLTAVGGVCGYNSVALPAERALLVPTIQEAWSEWIQALWRNHVSIRTKIRRFIIFVT